MIIENTDGKTGRKEKYFNNLKFYVLTKRSGYDKI